MRFRGLLACSVSAIALASAASTPAFADDQIETVVVTGIRASMDRAINIKRDSTSIVDAVSAEDIGKFSDKNVADALQRVPGMNTVSAASGEGGFDENDRVSARGTGPSLTQTLVDGHAVASGDWFILDQYQTIGRSVSYTLLPSEIVDTAKVYKSQQADLVEGGVAALVDIKTRNPLDFKDNLTIEGEAQAAYTTLRGNATPQINALLNWKNDAGTFGVMVQGFYEERDIRRDGQEFLGYSTVQPWVCTAPTPAVPTGSCSGNLAAASHPDLIGKAYPTLIGSALFEQDRIREGGNVTAEWRPTEEFDVKLSGFYSHLSASNINQNNMFWGTNEFNTMNNVPTSYTIKGKTITSAVFPAFAPAYTLPDGITVVAARPTAPFVTDFIQRPGGGAETYYIDGDVKWNPTATLVVTAQGGYSHGVGKTDPQVAWEGEIGLGTGNAGGYTITGNGVGVVSIPGVDTSNPANLINDWAWTAVSTAVDTEWYGKVDAEQQVQFGPINSIKAGLRYAVHTRRNDLFNGGVSYAGSIGSDVSTQNYPSDFADAFKVPGMLTNLPQGNTKLIEELLFNHTSWRPYPQTPAAISNPANGRFDWPGSMNMKENDFAGYVMANVGGDHWRGNFGVRIVSTREDIDLYVNDPTGLPSDFGRYGINNITHSYVDPLPSMNFSADITDDMVVRFAAAETMARPDYSALGGAVALTDTNLTGQGGNPNLKPVKSANYDLAYEWYYGEGSLFTATAFYMDLSSYVSYGTSTASYVNMTLTGRNPTPIYSTYTITSPFNSSGHNEGIELSLQQPIWGGFGAIANYTFADGEDNAGGPLVGGSRHTANLIGYYENDWMSARLSYNYRSKMLVGLDRSSNENQNAYSTLDASLQFTVTDWAAITIDALNLTNQTLKYYAADQTQPRALYSNGTQIYGGIRVKF
ncbi:MAG TPA: TonB-dependent receptor [Rhizomicrobium sp.]|nr:TonB-dependent receptor [Rhizomicrobium sp.]